MNRPSWDEYFLEMAFVVSKRSPDPSTQHGCVLVDTNNRVISVGYNGPIQGIDHDIVPFNMRPAKYFWMAHSEDNAVTFATRDLSGGTAYVTGPPCAPCFRRLLQAGIKRVVYGDRIHVSFSQDEQHACDQMAKALGVEVVQLYISHD